MFQSDKLIISIIVPVYNTPIAKLNRCFNSILNIKVLYECIVVDDGSTEQISNYCKEFCDIHPSFKFIHQKNSGVSAARNNGIENALAWYICFVDSDDEIIPEVYKYESFTGEDIIFSNLLVKSKNRNIVWQAFNTAKLDIEKVTIRLLTDGKLNGPVCKFIRKDFLNKYNIRFDEKIFDGEDAIFIRNILLKVPSMRYIDTSSYIYYKEKTSYASRIKKYKYEYLSNLDVVYRKSCELANLLIKDSNDKQDIINHLQTDYIGYMFTILCEAIKNNVFDAEFKNKVDVLISNFDFDNFDKIGKSEKLYYIVIRNKLWFVLKVLCVMREIYLEFIKKGD